MMECQFQLFRTKVEIASLAKKLRVTDNILFMGSCFAENIGGKLARAELRVKVNPLGVLYNPASIGKVLYAASHVESFQVPLLQRDGGWASWLSDSTSLAPTEDECRAKVCGRLKDVAQMLPTLHHLVLTLGTNRCYVLNETGEVVSNCHKQPDKCFSVMDLDVDACVEALAGPLGTIFSMNPSLQVVLTVSPFRYRKYGFHGNQLSKATLMLAVDRLCSLYPGRCVYFPAYEIVMDELRDYRFYADDMLHPSAQAVEYIWQCFVESGFSAEARGYLEEWEPIRRACEHRPLGVVAQAQQETERQRIEERKVALKRKYGLMND